MEIEYINKGGSGRYSKEPFAIYLKNDQIVIKMFLHYKLHGLDIVLVNRKKYKRKKIDISSYLYEVIKFFQEHTCMVPYGKEYIDLFDKSCVKRIQLENLKIEDRDIKMLLNFKNLRNLRTIKCTFYKNCNLGLLKCDLIDENSDLYSLDSLNGFSGDCISMEETHIVRMNKHLLHLNNKVLELSKVSMNYELFLLTTDAPNMRRLNIYCFDKLKNSDLLFISGFYNLEGIDIIGVVDNYDQFDKLEKLRKLKYVILSNINDNRKMIPHELEEKLSDVELANILCGLRLHAQNKHYQFRHELYVPRLERVKFEGSIYNQSIEEIRQKLLRFYQLDYQSRKNYLREPKKELNIFDEIHDLLFDTVTQPEDDEMYTVANSGGLFDSNGIDYYVKSKKIII